METNSVSHVFPWTSGKEKRKWLCQAVGWLELMAFSLVKWILMILQCLTWFVLDGFSPFWINVCLVLINLEWLYCESVNYIFFLKSNIIHCDEGHHFDFSQKIVSNNLKYRSHRVRRKSSSSSRKAATKTEKSCHKSH